MMDSELYKENILEHYKHPQNKGIIEGAKIGRGINPSCGDAIVMYVREDGGVVRDISFDGEGCAISIAGASMLTEFMKEKTMSEISESIALSLLGVEISPSRERCALLAYRALQEIF